MPTLERFTATASASPFLGSTSYDLVDIQSLTGSGIEKTGARNKKIVHLLYFAETIAGALFPGNEQTHTVGTAINLRLCLQNDDRSRQGRTSRDALRNQEQK